MPNWSDDEGRCYFNVDGTPCYQGGTGCPLHGAKTPAKRKRITQQDKIAAAYQRGAEAMREAAAKEVDRLLTKRRATAIWVAPDEIRALPLPVETT